MQSTIEPNTGNKNTSHDFLPDFQQQKKSNNSKEKWKKQHTLNSPICAWLFVLMLVWFHCCSCCYCASSNFNAFFRNRVVAFFCFHSFCFLHNDLSVACMNTGRAFCSGKYELNRWIVIGVESKVVVFVCIGGLWFFIIKWPTPQSSHNAEWWWHYHRLWYTSRLRFFFSLKRRLFGTL